MKKRLVPLVAALAAAIVALGAQAQTPTVALIAAMSGTQEVPFCQAAAIATGEGLFELVDLAAGTVRYRVVANYLPDPVTAAHIHVGAPGVPGAIVQPLNHVPGATDGVVVEGTFTNMILAMQLQANPSGYYVNVHTNLCPGGALRGQLAWRRYLPVILKNAPDAPGS